MIESKIVSSTSKSKEKKYPYIGRKEGGSFYVLFTGPKSGMILTSHSLLHPPGSYRTDIAESLYEITEDEVILKNSKETE